MKVLFQIRENAFSQRGGDTVDMERISSGLQALGVETEIDTSFRANPKEFDLAFLINFTLPQLLKQQAERLIQNQVPYAVLALNEDIPGFHAQSHRAAIELMKYASAGQPYSSFALNYPNVWNTPAAPRFENEWVARNAMVVLATGEREARVLKANYPGLNNIKNIELGFDPMNAGSAEDFYREFGVKDFVLCVGRIESRKNQLMLLKALEKDNKTVVLASGGFTYQPEYDAAVRGFKRAGQTLILNKLSAKQLSDAYAACKIHALPSWYELPGLVSMEAASLAKNVVVSDMGTTRDYFEDHAFYCDPASPDSVNNAVLAAWNAEPNLGGQAKIRSYTWSKTAEQVLKIIETATGKKSVATVDLGQNSQVMSVRQIVEKAEDIARSGDFSSALSYIRSNKTSNPSSSALWRAEGMLLIAMQDFFAAENALRVATNIDPKDSKVVCGLAICARQKANHKEAEDLLLHSLDLDQSNKIALLQLMGVAYDLNSFDSLESCLKQYLSINPSENDLTYALAGCLFKQNKFEEAQECCAKVLAANSNHPGAMELSGMIAEELKKLSVDNDTSRQAAPQKPALSAADMKNYDRLAEISEMKRKHDISKALTEVSSLLGDLAVNSPVLEDAYCLQGELLALNGQLFESERRFKAVLVQFPESFKAYCGLGAIHGEKTEWPAAEECFRKALMIKADCDIALAGLAMSSMSAGDKEASWHYYEKALEANPENLRAIYGIMELGYPQRKFGEIEKVLKNYLECHPANLELVYSLAGCLFAQDRLSEAVNEVDKILVLKPGDLKATELKEVISQKIATNG